METVSLRAHHLGTLYMDYAKNRKFGKYVWEKLLHKKIRITESNDDILCERCQLTDKWRCENRHKPLDRLQAQAFGFKIGKIYSFEDVITRIVEMVEKHKGREFWNDI